jgi:hypothetical protein
MIRAVVIAALLIGCKVTNEQSCDLPANANMPACSGGGDDAPPDKDAPQGCQHDMDCTADVNAPICNTTMHTCEACTLHTQCSATGNVCDPAGACIDEAKVAYVQNDGAGTTCTQAAPCAHLSDAIAVVKSDSRTHIMVKKGTDAVSDTNVSSFDAVDVTVVAEPNASVTRTQAGPIIEIKNAGANVRVFDLEVTGGLSGDAFVIQPGNTKLALTRVLIAGNGGRGVFSSGGSSITMRQCIVSGNTGGGANLQMIKLDIVNNVFAHNGSGGTTSGGLVLDPNAGSVLEFNTIADNVSSLATKSGVNCVGGVTAANNIVINNGLDASCTFSFSLVDLPVPVMGTDNVTGNASFMATDPATPTAPTYYRIKSDSAAINRADTAATVTTDIDNQVRPAGMADIGADEFH